ncbi:transcriptional regulator PhoP,regulator of virulence determinants [Salmonella enterica subsp. enterica serovar Daytona]|uniref:Transcriptional regulator PhoP,regulator of virulence determinants n=1 Tax=Salmonella enterica subsp. enterica serovar Daytona TaxID=1962639 RepID=A0A447JJB8_SALET|nr:transcriptional regulator PhoP,regulator of virulence determinants [Salmonella enterica subsp. enterica serovar Daytona]
MPQKMPGKLIYYLNEHLPDIAIVDLGLPDEDGLSLIRRWRSSDVFTAGSGVNRARRLAG